MGHARALLSTENARTQEEVAVRVKSENLSVREVENLMRGVSTKKTTNKSAKSQKLPANLQSLVEDMQRALGTKVVIKPKGQGGEIKIICYQAQDLSHVVKKITRA